MLHRDPSDGYAAALAGRYSKGDDDSDEPGGIQALRLVGGLYGVISLVGGVAAWFMIGTFELGLPLAIGIGLQGALVWAATQVGATVAATLLGVKRELVHAGMTLLDVKRQLIRADEGNRPG